MRVGPVGLGARDEDVGVARRRVGGRRHLLLGGVEHVAPAADLGGKVDDRDDDDEVDEDVLDERDDRRSAQPRGVGVEREDEERDEERQVLGDPVVAAADAGDLEDGLDADELQGDVGHRREEAGDGDREGQDPGPGTALDEVGRRHVAVAVRDRPEARHEDEDDGVEDDRVRDGEEAVDGPEGPHRGGHRDERVGRVEVAAEQEPRDPRAEGAAAEAPLLEALHARRGDASGRPRSRPPATTTKKKMRTARATPLTPAGVGGGSDGGHRVPSSRDVVVVEEGVTLGVHRHVRTCLEHEPVGGVRQGRADDHPEELVPDEEGEAARCAARPWRRCRRACRATMGMARSTPARASRPLFAGGASWRCGVVLTRVTSVGRAGWVRPCVAETYSRGARRVACDTGISQLVPIVMCPGRDAVS